MTKIPKAACSIADQALEEIALTAVNYRHSPLQIEEFTREVVAHVLDTVVRDCIRLGLREDLRFAIALTQARRALFDELARHYPELDHGDVPALETKNFDRAIEDFATAWVSGSGGAVEPPVLQVFQCARCFAITPDAGDVKTTDRNGNRICWECFSKAPDPVSLADEEQDDRCDHKLNRDADGISRCELPGGHVGQHLAAVRGMITAFGPGYPKILPNAGRFRASGYWQRCRKSHAAYGRCVFAIRHEGERQGDLENRMTGWPT